MKVEFSLPNTDYCNECPFLKIPDYRGICRITDEQLSKERFKDLYVRYRRPQWCKDKHGE